MGRVLTKDIFDLYLSDLRPRKQQKWYKRWKYHKVVVKMLEDIEFGRVLELGADYISVISDSDIMDAQGKFPQQRTIEKKYDHNAMDVPWPVEDNKYDLFIALQVWEHLGSHISGNHENAFREVMRISNMAILSVPYKWKTNNKDSGHGNIDDDVLSRWTLNLEPFKQKVVTSGGRKRKIVFFKF